MSSAPTPQPARPQVSALRRLLRPAVGVAKKCLKPVFVKAHEIAAEGEFEVALKYAMTFLAGNQVEGDYLEFGASRGTTFSAAFRQAQRAGLDAMRFLTFDSFEGLPEISGLDVNKDNPYFAGQYACSLDEFKAIIIRNGVDMRKVTITQGWYDKVLNDATRQKLQIKKAAVVWIDCDLYESTVPALNFVTDYIQNGTIIFFDDWFCFRGDPNKGECRAFKEWLARNPKLTAIEYRKFESAGISFIMNVAE